MTRLAPVLLLLAAFAPAVAEETVPCLAVEPREPWRAERWPVVVYLVEPGAALKPAADLAGDLTQTRGALLVVLHGRSDEVLRQALRQVAQIYPLAGGSIYLMARDSMADWARQVAFKRDLPICGLLTIDAPSADLPKGRGGGDLKVALLVVKPQRLAANQKLAKALDKRSVPCALAVVKAEELKLYLGAALTEMLPPTPARTEVYDSATHCTLKAPPGWEFQRDDKLFAMARRAGAVGGPHIEVATGIMAQTSFDEYVAATLSALRVPGIELLENERITTDTDGVTAHSFYFLDHRGRKQAQPVSWVQVAKARSIVSFRCCASQDELKTLRDTIRKFALMVAFDR